VGRDDFGFLHGFTLGAGVEAVYDVMIKMHGMVLGTDLITWWYRLWRRGHGSFTTEDFTQIEVHNLEAPSLAAPSAIALVFLWNRNCSNQGNPRKLPLSYLPNSPSCVILYLR